MCIRDRPATQTISPARTLKLTPRTALFLWTLLGTTRFSTSRLGLPTSQGFLSTANCTSRPDVYKRQDIRCAVQITDTAKIPSASAVAIYDAFEAIIEATLPGLQEILFCAEHTAQGWGLRCSVQCTDAPAALPDLPQMQLERDDDGLLYFTMFPAEGGAIFNNPFHRERFLLLFHINLFIFLKKMFLLSLSSLKLCNFAEKF